VKGRVATGSGQGRHFTQLDWARRQFVQLEDAESIDVWHRLRKTPGARIENPNDGPNDCDGRCYPITIEGRIDAAIVLPEVAGYSPVQIEVIAAVGLREALDVKDGESVRLKIEQTG
jgi:CTP-dependent riboflavin kinase